MCSLYPFYFPWKQIICIPSVASCVQTIKLLGSVHKAVRVRHLYMQTIKDSEVTAGLLVCLVCAEREY